VLFESHWNTPPNKKSPLFKTAGRFTPIDVPEDWDPRANQSHAMALIASLRAAALFESRWAPPPNKKSAVA